MIDDDCEPVPEWLAAMLDTQQRTAAGAVTGTMVRRGSTEEPFLEYDLHHPGDGAQLQLAATFNSMISSRWLKDHPTIRFQPDLGFTSGEDMAFYGAARAAGLKFTIHKGDLFTRTNRRHAPHSHISSALSFGTVTAHMLPAFVTGSFPSVCFFAAQIHCERPLLDLLRLFKGERPQMRYCLASVLHASGIMAFGFTIPFKLL